MKNENRLLLVQALRRETGYPFIFSGPRDYRKSLLRYNPEMREWIPEKTFDMTPLLPNRLTIDFWTYGVNTPGTFIAANIKTPTKVINGFIEEKKLIRLLEQAKERNRAFTHVGFSINVNAFSVFVKCAKAVRKFDENIKIIAGNVGSIVVLKNEMIN